MELSAAIFSYHLTNNASANRLSEALPELLFDMLVWEAEGALSAGPAQNINDRFCGQNARR
jgi:hypothetical protein